MFRKIFSLKRGKTRMTQRQGSVKLVVLCKLNLAHWVSPATGLNPLHFFVLIQARLYGLVCNELIIFIAPH